MAALATKNLTLLKTNTSSPEESAGATSFSRLSAISKSVQTPQDTPPLVSSPMTSSELVACAAPSSSSQVPVVASEARRRACGLAGRACFARSLSLRNATPWDGRHLQQQYYYCSRGPFLSLFVPSQFTLVPTNDNTSTSEQNSSSCSLGEHRHTIHYYQVCTCVCFHLGPSLSPMDKVVTASVLAQKSPSDVRPTIRMLSEYEVAHSHPAAVVFVLCAVRYCCVFASRV